MKRKIKGIYKILKCTGGLLIKCYSAGLNIFYSFKSSNRENKKKREQFKNSFFNQISILDKIFDNVILLKEEMLFYYYLLLYILSMNKKECTNYYESIWICVNSFVNEIINNIKKNNVLFYLLKRFSDIN